jgi:hypothetical protein
MKKVKSSIYLIVCYDFDDERTIEAYSTKQKAYIRAEFLNKNSMCAYKVKQLFINVETDE